MRRVRSSNLRDFLRRLLLLGESPHRTALGFGVGVLLGFSPFWGLHTALGLLVTFLFRFNRLAVLAGVWVNNPWTVAPAASLGTALGFMVLGTEGEFPGLPETSVLSSGFWDRLLSDFEYLILPFVIGNSLLALMAGATAYFVLRWVLVRNATRARWRAP